MIKSGIRAGVIGITHESWTYASWLSPSLSSNFFSFSSSAIEREERRSKVIEVPGDGAAEFLLAALFVLSYLCGIIGRKQQKRYLWCRCSGASVSSSGPRLPASWVCSALPALLSLLSAAAFSAALRLFLETSTALSKGLLAIISPRSASDAFCRLERLGFT